MCGRLYDTFCSLGKKIIVHTLEAEQWHVTDRVIIQILILNPHYVKDSG